MSDYKIVKFIDNEFEIDVRTDRDNDTVWLTQDEMALLFDVDRTRIVRHISNIYSDGELDLFSTCAENAQVQVEGARKVKRRIKIYNLDMIISVGYRIKSKRGIIFRKWANKILKEYLIQGYSVNEKRINYLNKTIEIQSKILASSLNIDEASLVNVVNEYTKALDLLDDYDHQCVSKPNGRKTVYKPRSIFFFRRKSSAFIIFLSKGSSIC